MYLYASFSTEEALGNIRVVVLASRVAERREIIGLNQYLSRLDALANTENTPARTGDGVETRTRHPPISNRSDKEALQ